MLPKVLLDTGPLVGDYPVFDIGIRMRFARHQRWLRCAAQFLTTTPLASFLGSLPLLARGLSSSPAFFPCLCLFLNKSAKHGRRRRVPSCKEGQRAEERGERGGSEEMRSAAEPPLMPRAAHPHPLF